MGLLFFVQSIQTTCRPLWENPSSYRCYPRIRLFNAGATDVFLRTSTMSSGSSESSGICLKSSQYSHDWLMYPGDNLYAFTTGTACNVHVFLSEEIHSGASAPAGAS